MNQKKDLILGILREAAEALSVDDVYHGLGAKVPKRTIRRHLHEMVAGAEVESIGSNRNRRYLAAKTEGGFFSKQSQELLQRLAKPIYERQPQSYHTKWLQNYRPNVDYYLKAEQRRILMQHGQQTLEAQPVGTIASKLYNRLLIDLSYNSSRLEGNTYSLLETQNLLIAGKEAFDKLDAEKMMLLNHKDAISFLVNNIADIDVSVKNLRTMHYLLSDSLVLPENAGNLRKEQVRITGSVYIPLDNYEVLQQNFELICEKAKAIIDPYEQSVFLLIHLSYLQAFIDVNKRTARLACNIPLLANNLIPISFNEISVEDYRRAIIAVYELNAVEPLLDLYIWSYVRSSSIYKATIESLGFDSLRLRYRGQRRELIGNIIRQGVVQGIDEFIDSYIKDQIPEDDRLKFKKDILTELNLLSEARIAGMGVTKQQFQEWLASKQNQSD